MLSKWRREMGLVDAARARAAIAGMAAAAEPGDAALAGVLAGVGELIEKVDTSLAQYARTTPPPEFWPAPGMAAAGAFRERLERQFAAGTQAFETLHQAFSNALSLALPAGRDDFRYCPTPDEAAPSPALPDAPAAQLLAVAPATYRSDGRAGDALFLCQIETGQKLGRFVDVNEAACRLLGYTRDELLAMSLADIGRAPGSIDCEGLVADVLAGRSVIAETVHLAKDGRRIPVEIQAHGVALAERPALLTLVRDLTRREQAEEQLRLWHKAFEASADAIVITDSHERIVSVNRAVTEITGYTPAEVIGKTPRIFASGRQDKMFYRDMWQALLSAGHWHGEIWDRRKNGEIYPKWLSISAVTDHQSRVTHYIASFSDITVRKNYEEQIQFLAYHDPLTGLPNRRRLQELFNLDSAHARRKGCKLHLLFLDLDHFKDINDTLGHAGGDLFLQATTERLKSGLRATDVIARLGGDEFVILLSDTHGAVDLPHIAGKLLAALEPLIDIDGTALKASTSIGVSVFPDDGQDFESLLHKADTAMYAAKQQGRGTYLYFDDSMNAADKERAVIASHLRVALERGEIFLRYRVRRCLVTGATVGVEAILCWENPLLGALDADRFMPLAEDCGLTAQISEWALGEACRQAVSWHGNGRTGFSVALKLLTSQYRNKDFIPLLTRVLADSGADAACIELGVAEVGLGAGRSGMLKTLRRVKELGFRLFIDRFGSGVSSLGFLKEFAVDSVKLDSRLVAALPAANGGLVRAAIQMASCLDVAVIADGVGNKDQVAFLRAAGCNFGQGPLFGDASAEPTSASGAIESVFTPLPSRERGGGEGEIPLLRR